MMCPWCGGGQCGQAQVEQRQQDQGVRFKRCAWEVVLGAGESTDADSGNCDVVFLEIYGHNMRSCQSRLSELHCMWCGR